MLVCMSLTAATRAFLWSCFDLDIKADIFHENLKLSGVLFWRGFDAFRNGIIMGIYQKFQVLRKRRFYMLVVVKRKKICPINCYVMLFCILLILKLNYRDEDHVSPNPHTSMVITRIMSTFSYDVKDYLRTKSSALCKTTLKECGLSSLGQ